MYLCVPFCPCVSRWWGERGLSVTCPHSELGPFSHLSGSPVPLLLTSKSLSSTLCPSEFSAFDLHFQCKFYLCSWLWLFTYLNARLEQIKSSSRWCPNTDSCSLLLDRDSHTLETLINKILKHLVKLIIWCPPELCPTPSLNKRCWQHQPH